LALNSLVSQTLLSWSAPTRLMSKFPAPIGHPKQAPDYEDVTPLATALIAANAYRIVWGTDWPHPNSSSGNQPTEVTPLFHIDDGRLLNQLAVWAPDAVTRKKILVDNPGRLYQF
jgi:predicted TIM-barrel fold metal-dependent hydrolase